MQNIWHQTDSLIKEKRVPIDIILELTQRCNLACCHCYNLKNGLQLNFEQVKKIIGQLRRSGCLFLTLTGGEVFTHKDFFKIAFYIRKAGLDLRIFTNGTLITKEKASRLKELLPSEIGISIHAAKPEIHDSITNFKGSFEKSINAVRMLKERKLPVHIKSTLMKENFDQYHELTRLANNLGVLCIADPVISPRDNGSKDVLAHRLNKKQMTEFFSNEFSKIPKISEQNEDFFFCEAGKTFGSISASGDVYPCIQLPLKAGNVFEEEFGKIWAEAPILNKMRSTQQRQLRACSSCSIDKYCYRCPGLAFVEDGDAFGPSQIACFMAETSKKLQGAS